jgi:hypothetical protein
MSDPKSRLSAGVEVFTRATADALNRAIGEVLDARSPWQLLNRLSRIVFLGLVLYLGWILVVVQPDLAQRLMLPQTPNFQQRHALHREQVQKVLQTVAAPGFGLHVLVVAEWHGGEQPQAAGGAGPHPPAAAGARR